MARRSKLTDAVQMRICQAIQAGATYEMAANLVGVRRQTIATWLVRGEKQSSGRYRTFFDAFKKAEALCCVANLAVIKKSAQEGTWQAAAWLLERRFPEYARGAPPPVQIMIDADDVSVKTLVNEYSNFVQPLLEGPTIDLDEE